MRSEIEGLRRRLAETEEVFEALCSGTMDDCPQPDVPGTGVVSSGDMGVSSEDTIGEARNAATTLERRSSDQATDSYYAFFENSPVPLWEDNYSHIKDFIEERRREGVENFREYFRENPDAVKTCADLLQIVDVNFAAMRLHGAESKEMLLANLSAVFTEDAFRVFEEQLVAIAEKRTVVEAECVVQTIDGNEVPVYLKWAVLPGAEETLERVQVATWDITDHRRVQQQLVESEEKFRSLYEQSSVAIQLYDLRGNLIRVNQKTLELFGLENLDFLKNFNFWDDPKLSPEDGAELKKGNAVQISAEFDFDSAKEQLQFPTNRSGTIDLDMHVVPFRIKDDTIGYVVEVLETTAQKEAERELIRLAEERQLALNELSENQRIREQAEYIARAGSWELNIATRDLKWSASMYEVFGVRFQKPTFDLVRSLVHPDDLPWWEENVEHMIRKGSGPFEYEFRIVRPDGAIAWIHTMVEIVCNDVGGPLKFVGMAQDITERKSTEEELRRIEWLLTKSVSGILQELDKQPAYGDLTELNECRLIADSVGRKSLHDIAVELMSLLGTSISVYESNGDYACRLLYSEWCRCLDQSSRKLCDTSDNREALRSGKWIHHVQSWDRAAASAIECGRPVNHVSNCGSRVYAVPIRSGDDVVGAISVWERVPEFHSESFKKIADEYQVDVKVLRQAASSYKPRPKYIIEMAKEHVASSARLIGEIVERRRSEAKYRVTQQQLLEQQNEAKLRVEAELEKTREELVRKTRLAAVGQLSGSIAHELRNPLGALRTAAYYLKNYGLNDDGKSTRFLDVIDRQTGRADQIINNLLEMTRAKEPVTERVDLREILDEAISSTEGVSGVKVSIVLDPDPFVFHVDAGQFRQVISNLIRNAVQAMGGKGELSFSATCRDSVNVICVRDSGPGIPQKLRDNLFEPLVTSKVTGTGLGLSICRQIVQRHGGQIEVVENETPGACFRISLPYRDA
ncbi:PAS domain S-box protein [Rhodopirellula sallentina]|uniref:histidine kinase n=1 Tax=Rhodopirellula sallentina SM41 TaxID=1263870 RepID=M5U6Q6_9BACT|nr:PAS domain S-box protein [Rhodopirellula sallentina]EMI57152.1 protein containing ATP-binding region, ATPase-like protein [Rhodopirellula sallentina SM41]